MPEIIGHAGIVRELQALAMSEEPPHALLFAGPDGVGRTALAIEYARLLNCERLHPEVTAGASLFGDDLPSAASSSGKPCGECRSCRLIEEGAHPDVITLGPGDTLCRPRDGESHAKHPDSRDIRICQVRGLIDLSSRFPFEARYRLVIIDPADRLDRNGAAAHTILKTLEEPPGHTVFCLVTAAPEDLIETIVSRCRRIDVRPVPRAVIEAGLVARGIEPGLAARAADASHGSPGRALQFAGDPDLIGARGRLLERCTRVASEGTGARFRYAAELAERWREDRLATLVEFDVWESFWEERLRLGAGEGESHETLAGYVEALNAIRQARADLHGNVLARAAIELMLLSFPRVTLAISPEEEPVAYA
ncbi:MAG: ATP-binding protein [Dehalococcoidia bacterium]